MKPKVKNFFDPETFTLTYVVSDPKTLDALVIDPVWDYDQASSTLALHSYQEVKNYILENNLKLHAVLETHAHADHLSSAQFFKKDFNVPVGIGIPISKVQKVLEQ